MLNTLPQGSKGVSRIARVNSVVYLTVISIAHAVEIVGLYHILKRCNGSLWDTKRKISGRRYYSVANDYSLGAAIHVLLNMMKTIAGQCQKSRNIGS